MHGKKPNFPFFYPLIFHDIATEIKRQDQPTVRGLYSYWLIVVATLIWNTIATLFILLAHAKGITTGGTDFGVSFVYTFFITALSFILWYRPAYNAYMKDRAMYYFFFFVFFGFHLLFALYMAIGIPGSGSAGLINYIAMYADGKILAGVFGTVASILWFGQVLSGVWLMKIVHDHFRNKGHSFNEARAQAMTTVAFQSLV